MIKYENFVIVISAPSGCGKSTIVKKLLQEVDNLSISISATSRQPRGKEVDCIDYHFLTKEEFEKRIKENKFLEYATVHDNYYGTLKSEVEKKWNNGKDIILDIDCQGGQQISKQLEKNKLLKIFILPPSMEALKERIINRAENSAEEIEKRLKNSRNEVNYASEYDFVVINDDLDIAINEIKSIITTKRIANIDKNELKNFINNLQKY